MNYKDVIKAGEDYTSLLNEFLDSGQLPENGNQFEEKAQSAMYEIEQANKELETIFTPKPTKKPYLVTAEFTLNGRVDLMEDERINLEVFGWKITPKPNSESILQSLADIFDFMTVEYEDILLLKVFCDTKNDILNINFSFQTDRVNAVQDFDKKDFAIYTNARKQTLGYSYVNKAYFKNSNISEIPAKIWEYPCYGFSLPYSLEFKTNDDVKFLLTQITEAVQPNGELADLRLFSRHYKMDVTPLVNKLMILKWKSILTQWERHYLLPDGVNYRTIKIG